MARSGFAWEYSPLLRAESCSLLWLVGPLWSLEALQGAGISYQELLGHRSTDGAGQSTNRQYSCTQLSIRNCAYGFTIFYALELMIYIDCAFVRVGVLIARDQGRADNCT